MLTHWIPVMLYGVIKLGWYIQIITYLLSTLCPYLFQCWIIIFEVMWLLTWGQLDREWGNNYSVASDIRNNQDYIYGNKEWQGYLVKLKYYLRHGNCSVQLWLLFSGAKMTLTKLTTGCHVNCQYTTFVLFCTVCWLYHLSVITAVIWMIGKQSGIFHTLWHETSLVCIKSDCEPPWYAFVVTAGIYIF